LELALELVLDSLLLLAVLQQTVFGVFSVAIKVLLAVLSFFV
jgi:hypothetical protein